MLELVARGQNQPITPTATVVGGVGGTTSESFQRRHQGEEVTLAVNMSKLEFDITGSVWARSFRFIG